MKIWTLKVVPPGFPLPELNDMILRAGDSITLTFTKDGKTTWKQSWPVNEEKVLIHVGYLEETVE